MNDSNPFEITQDQKGDPGSGAKSSPLNSSEESERPLKIGRYRIENILGQGGFGLVYLAHDEQLDRPVAVKVPHKERITKPEDAEAYLTEARTVANLDHSGIVPVYDVGSTDQYPYYVVSKYIEGQSLSQLRKERQLGYRETAEIIATIAEAIHYAHKKGLVHRDIKPANILIGRDGQPKIVDFGLALREENIGKGPQYAGTAAYMSPEQARGEGHRVDGRSDIFSLGVVFYELLSGRRPFRGDSEPEILEQVVTYEPRPLRQFDEKLPKELERICGKALSKRARERYSSAHDLASDLRCFLSEQTVLDPSPDASTRIGVNESSGIDASASHKASQTDGPSQHSDAPRSASLGLGSNEKLSLKIVPKGLRSFDANDAEFYLELLPGPRDRAGLPDSLRFWKSKIEDADSENTFSVGLIYGPSGCGKSSFIKAGLLPRLSDQMIPLYVEATPGDTEARLLRVLRKGCPALDDRLTLKESVAALRQGQGVPAGKKVLIVLDQFEQWLHAKKDEENTELVETLRQCDGGRVQCIVMVRDDFWLAVSRFLHDLEVPLIEGHNIALADLFDVDHARKVLAAFGRAFGRLPENVNETTREEKNFLSQAVDGLSDAGKVICVRLALFAEMMKGKPWTPATLKKVGGTSGIGKNFLDETFSSSAASPEHRLHQKAARAVLHALLPNTGRDIKGYMRSSSELMELSGYKNRPKDFHDLIRILDREVRLITPTDPDGVESDDEAVSTDKKPGEKYYQLTHDYLVGSLREWLTQKQKQTWKGRTELLLDERSEAWNMKPEKRFLPSWGENLRIRLLTRQQDWTQTQRAMMASAGRHHLLRTGVVVASVLLFAFVAIMIRNNATDRQRDLEATRLVEGLLQADTSQVATIIDRLEDYREWANDDLKLAFQESILNSNAKLHSALALALTDADATQFLKDRLLTVQPIQFGPVCAALGPVANQWVAEYWKLANDQSLDSAVRFQAACALARFDAENHTWTDPDFGRFVASRLVNVFPSHLLIWRDALRPVGKQLAGPLAEIYRDENAGEQSRSFATDTLCDFLKDESAGLYDLLADSNHQQFGPLFVSLGRHRAEAIELAKQEIRRPCPPDSDESKKEQMAVRQANAAVMLFKMGAADQVWPLLRFQPDPRVRSNIIHWLAPAGADPNPILDRLEVETDVTIRRALLLSLGEFDASQLPVVVRNDLTNRLMEIFKTEPDSGLHSASEWLLRTWEQTTALESAKNQIKKRTVDWDDDFQNRKWYINQAGQTFAIFDAGEMKMGSPPTEPDHYSNEVVRIRRINRKLAFSSTQVTKGQYREFCKTRQLDYNADRESLQPYIPTDQSPMVAISWFEAAEYCNWLSQQEGIPSEQWCYLPNDSDEYGPGMKAKENFLELTGYRLPTEPEWEFACRAGTTTSRYYGFSSKLLKFYAWYGGNNINQTRPVATRKPNDFGLFDMQGNAFDWCYNLIEDDGEDLEPDDDKPSTEPVNAVDSRILRGGSFVATASTVRSAQRYFNQPEARRLGTGFRVVRTLPAQ